jgi:predicted ThiF/HesA family dinucleotide-utilizing enzyme
VALDFVLRTLMDLPADALPGENKSEAIRKLLTESACREVEAVGEEACRTASALIQTVVDRIANEVHATAELSAAAGQRPC